MTNLRRDVQRSIQARAFLYNRYTKATMLAHASQAKSPKSGILQEHIAPAGAPDFCGCNIAAVV